MRSQTGSTIIIAMILLTVLTVLVLYALEGTNFQSKMVRNSLTTPLTYQECRNEHQAQLLKFNKIEDSTDFAMLLSIAGIPKAELESEEYKEIIENLTTPETSTQVNNPNPPKSNIQITWEYVQDASATRGGYDLGTDSQYQSYVYQSDCIASLSSTTNSQTLGATVHGLKQAGITN